MANGQAVPLHFGVTLALVSQLFFTVILCHHSGRDSLLAWMVLYSMLVSFFLGSSHLQSPCSSFTGNPPSAHMLSCSVVFDSLQPCGLQPARLLCQDLPGKNTGVGCHPLVQGFFPTQGLSLGLPHCRQTVSHLSHQGSPVGK